MQSSAQCHFIQLRFSKAEQRQLCLKNVTEKSACVDRLHDVVLQMWGPFVSDEHAKSTQSINNISYLKNSPTNLHRRVNKCWLLPHTTYPTKQWSTARYSGVWAEQPDVDNNCWIVIRNVAEKLPDPSAWSYMHWFLLPPCWYNTRRTTDVRVITLQTHHADITPDAQLMSGWSLSRHTMLI